MNFDIASFNHIPEPRQRFLIGVAKEYDKIIKSSIPINLTLFDNMWGKCLNAAEIDFLANVELTEFKKQSLFEIALRRGKFSICINLIGRGFNLQDRWNSTASHTLWDGFLKGLETSVENNEEQICDFFSLLIDLKFEKTKDFGSVDKLVLDIINRPYSDMVFSLIQILFNKKEIWNYFKDKNIQKSFVFVIVKYMHTPLIKWGVEISLSPFNQIQDFFMKSINFDGEMNEEVIAFWNDLIKIDPSVESYLKMHAPRHCESSYQVYTQARIDAFWVWLTAREKEKLSKSLKQAGAVAQEDQRGKKRL